MSDDTTDRLAEIEARVNAATEGPWRLDQEWALIGHGPDSVLHGYFDGECPACGDQMSEPAKITLSGEDAEFIAHARSDVPYLLDQVRTLTAENEKLRWGNESLAAQIDVEEQHATGVCDVCTHLESVDVIEENDRLAAENERLNEDCRIHLMKRYEVEAERDRLAETVQRVEAEAEAYAAQPDVLEPCGAVAQSIRAALNPTSPDGGAS